VERRVPEGGDTIGDNELARLEQESNVISSMLVTLVDGDAGQALAVIEYIASRLVTLLGIVMLAGRSQRTHRFRCW